MQFGVRRACNRNSPLLLNMWCSVDLSFQLGMKYKLIRECGLNNVVEDFLTLSLTVWFLTVSVQKLSHSSYALYTIFPHWLLPLEYTYYIYVKIEDILKDLPELSSSWVT